MLYIYVRMHLLFFRVMFLPQRFQHLRSQAASRPNCESSNVRSRCPPLDPDQLVAAGTTRCFQKDTGWWLSHLKNEFVSWDDDIPNMMGKNIFQSTSQNMSGGFNPKNPKI